MSGVREPVRIAEPGEIVDAAGESIALLRLEALALLDGLGRRPQRIELEQGDSRLSIEWPAVVLASAEIEPAASTVAEPGSDAIAHETGTDHAGHAITAPLVGTFYRRPSPDADPFVEIGDVVVSGQPVALVEAMKLMNEIVADTAGTVVAIGPDDGEMVEFGQLLVEIDPG